MDLYERHLRAVSNKPTVAGARTSAFTTGRAVSLPANHSYDLARSIASYEWAVGDDATVTGDVSFARVRGTPEYVVTIAVHDEDGASDTETLTVTVSSLKNEYRVQYSEGYRHREIRSRPKSAGILLILRNSDIMQATFNMREDNY